MSRIFFTYDPVIQNFKIQKHGSSVIQVLDESGGAAVPAGIPMWFSYTSHLGIKVIGPGMLLPIVGHVRRIV